MSLVNDMLRDLNKRTPVSIQAARVHGTINSSIENKRPRFKFGLILAGGLLAGLGGGYLYFESMGVQVVQVPLARVPAQQGVVAPSAVQPEATTQSQAPAPVEPATVASGNIVEILEQSIQPNGFTLRIKATEQVTFDVRDRSAYGLTLHLDGIDDYSRANTTIPGVSVLQASNGLDIGIELNDPTDFLVYEDADTEEFDILLTASFRPEEISAADAPAAQQLVNTGAPDERLLPPALDNESSSAPQSTAAQRASVRVSRELSLEEQDRNTSQAAVMMMQGGRIGDAYQHLRTFLEVSPTAHQSRETLATLLFAQREYAQARIVVDAGLNQVPNYAAFKKIKARLLMQDNDPAQALTLLRNLPPAVATDTEYHELLATLYRQGNLHEQAISTYKDLLRIDSQQGSWWAGLGISLEAQDKDSDALVSYKTALQSANLDTGLRQYVQNRISNLNSQQ